MSSVAAATTTTAETVTIPTPSTPTPASRLPSPPAPALVEPYQSLVVLPELQHGWQNNRDAMQKFISVHFPDAQDLCIAEIGAWLGLSIRDWVKFAGESGRVYAIDHWEGSVEHQPGQFAHHSVLPRLYPQFLSNMIQWGIANSVTPIRMSSVNAARTLNIRPDIVYVDGAHDYANVDADIRAWYPKLSDRGILCGDDWKWMHDLKGVQRAVNGFASEYGLEVHVDDNFWWLTSPPTP